MAASNEALGDAFQRAIEYWRRHRREIGAATENKPRPMPIAVAISREAGSGGRFIADQLGVRLRWPVYDKELVEQISRDAGLNAEMVDSVDEHRSSFFVETLEAFVGASTIGGASYVHRLAKTLAGLAAHSDCVIVGRGASLILPPPSTVSIRIVASPSDRVARYCELHEVKPTVATTELKRIERERADFVKRYFHKDVGDPHLYDLVLNTSRFSDETCLGLCEHAVRQKQASLQSAQCPGTPSLA
jgi:hypothetical protein